MIKFKFKVTDNKGNISHLWAYGTHTKDDKHLGIKDKIINTLDMSNEPFTIYNTGEWKYDDNIGAIYNQD